MENSKNEIKIYYSKAKTLLFFAMNAFFIYFVLYLFSNKDDYYVLGIVTVAIIYFSWRCLNYFLKFLSNEPAITISDGGIEICEVIWKKKIKWENLTGIDSGVSLYVPRSFEVYINLYEKNKISKIESKLISGYSTNSLCDLLIKKLEEYNRK